MIGEGRSQRMGGAVTRISGGQLPVGCGSQPPHRIPGIPGMRKRRKSWRRISWRRSWRRRMRKRKTKRSSSSAVKMKEEQEERGE